MRTIFNFVFMLSIAAIFLSCGDDSNPTDNSIPNINITALIPANNATKVSTNSQTFQITFDDTVTKGTGSIRIYLEDGDLLFSSLDVASGVTFSKNKVTFKFSKRLEIGKKLYILIDKGAFLIDGKTEYSGLMDKSVWRFTCETVEEKQNVITAKILSFGKTTNYITEEDNCFFEKYYPDSLRMVHGAMFINIIEYNEIRFIFPAELEINKNYDLKKMIKDVVYYEYRIGSSHEFGVTSGSLKLITKNDEYWEGEFSFNAWDIINATNGYFFVKNE